MSASHGIRRDGKGSVVKTTAWGYLSALSAAMLAAGLLLASQSLPGSAAAQTWETVRSSDFEVTDGAIKPSHNWLIVESPEMRAVLLSSIHRKAEVNFTYLGPTSRANF